MKRTHLVVLIVVTLTAMGSVRAALADAAPPEPPPGSSIGSGEPSTYVQMVSESVVMVVTDYNGPPFSDLRALATDMMVGHVQAYFTMVNQGAETETLAVRFPLGESDGGYSGIKTVENFIAYVDGHRVETKTIEQAGKRDYLIPWATWEVTFVPRGTVNLGVVYDVRPEGFAPWGRYTYILETGTGWYGPIGEGTITFRMPYEVSDLNVVLDRGDSYWLPNPDTYTVSGTDVIWQFNDLEPTEEDNIHLTVLPPIIWRRIEQAQASVEANPDSVNARLKLAHVLREGLNFKNGLICCTSVANEAAAVYEQALELAPNNVDIYVEYLEFLLDLWFTPDPTSRPEQIEAVLAEALAIAPDDSRLLDIQGLVAVYQQQAEGYQTQWASTFTDTPTLPVEAMPTLSPSPSLTMTPIPNLTMSPTFKPTDVSMVVPPSTPPIPLWLVIGAAAIGGAGVGVWAYRRRRSTSK